MDDPKLISLKNTFGAIAALILAGLAALAPIQALAQARTGAVTPPASIDRAVERFTGAAIGEPGGARLPVDRRLRLAPCPSELALQWYGKNGDSVMVRCPSGPSWKLFVAVSPGEHNYTSPTPSAARNIARPDNQPLIARGESVAIKVRGNGFVLSRQGEALESGALGQWIRIRPHDPSKRYVTAKPVRAKVSAPGVAVMRLP